MPSEGACSPAWLGDAESVRTGSREELERELETLHEASFAWALACCDGQYHDAEDVLQTVYLKILEGKARWRGTSSWKTWLFAVIRHTASQRRRRRLWRSGLLDRWWGGSDGSHPIADPEMETRWSQRSARIRRALGALSERQRQMLELVFYHDLTVRDAAEVLGLRLGTARTHYQRGKTRLRDELQRVPIRREEPHGSA